MARPTIGDTAPPLALPDHQGEQWRSVEHRGRPIVVIFHRHIH